MINVFVDCGANLGQGYNKLIKRFGVKFDKVYMFEPNLKTFNKLRKIEHANNMVFMQKAVYNKNCIKSLNIEYCPSEKDFVGCATNILENIYVKPNYIANEYMTNIPDGNVKVECVDISEFVKNNLNNEDFNVLKLDIEGVEYEVLDKLIDDNLLSYFDTVIVEWHPHIRSDKVKDIEYYLNIFRKNNIEYIHWD